MSTPTTHPALAQQWTAKFKPLIGRTIKGVRYLAAQEAAGCGWHRAAIVLYLDDGTLLWPSADDEGNDAGALFIQPGTQTAGIPETAPVLPL